MPISAHDSWQVMKLKFPASFAQQTVSVEQSFWLSQKIVMLSLPPALQERPVAGPSGTWLSVPGGILELQQESALTVRLGTSKQDTVGERHAPVPLQIGVTRPSRPCVSSTAPHAVRMGRFVVVQSAVVLHCPMLRQRFCVISALCWHTLSGVGQFTGSQF